MSRTFNREDSLVIASHNPGKVREISDLLQPWVSRLSVQESWG